MRHIRDITPADLDACAALLIDAYNCPPWDNQWTLETARRYLSELIAADRFKGFLMTEDGAAIAAAFCHARTWWTADELYVDEFFVATAMQRRGLGGELMEAVEQSVRVQGLAGVTLLTDRRFPARGFYISHGFQPAENVLFLYKVLQ